ncbi:hypothetical protein Tco_1458706 [Tanacetum coccineum]
MFTERGLGVKMDGTCTKEGGFVISDGVDDNGGVRCRCCGEWGVSGEVRLVFGEERLLCSGGGVRYDDVCVFFGRV